MTIRPYCLLVFIAAASVILADAETDNFGLLKKGLVEYFKAGKSKDLSQATKSYKLTHIFREHNDIEQYAVSEVCEICQIVVNLAVAERRAGMTRANFADLLEGLCVALDIEVPRVCHGAISIDVDFYLYIIDNVPDLTAEQVCGSLLASEKCPVGNLPNWSVDIPSGNSAERPELTQPGTGSFNVLQVTDIHIDNYYQLRGKAVCPEPICCQSDQGLAETEGEACGYWSDYRNADTPWYLFEEAVAHMKAQEYDYLYYTGDTVARRIWNTSVENNTATISRLHNYLRENFEGPIFPIFGNHEPHPFNVWPNDDVDNDQISIKWLLKQAADEWSVLIGEDVSETVGKGGYYSLSPKPGFRIIAINTNLCLTAFNWWLVYDYVDPFDQLQWLADELKKAEDANESVHILGHVPTGDGNCLPIWSREYHSIIERFAYTITAQFNGHTHHDEFQIYYNRSEPTQPINVAFNGAALTPFPNSNPSYKLYKVDDSNFAILDFEEWTFNLTQANSRPDPTASPEWFRLYSFAEVYGVENLLPSELGKVVEKMTTDHSLLQEYFRYFSRAGDPAIAGGCDDECLKGYLCNIVRADSGDETQCNYFSDLFDKAKRK